MDQLKGFTFTPQQLRMYGIIGSVVGIYLTVGLNVLTGTKLFSFIGSIAALFAVLWARTPFVESVPTVSVQEFPRWECCAREWDV